MREKGARLYWILPGRLAGMAHPGQSDAVLDGLREAGIGAIVTLTQRALSGEAVNKFGFEYLHLPVKDFCAPAPGQVERFVRFCDEQTAAGRAVAVHCRAGIGRTGVMLACYLVHLGEEPRAAIRKVRKVRPGALESAEQENAVYEFVAVDHGSS